MATKKNTTPAPKKASAATLKSRVIQAAAAKKTQQAAAAQTQRTAIAWFFSLIKGLKGAGTKTWEGAEVYNPVKDPLIGQMIFFFYDAKHKETLPYWDKFPLVIPIGMYPNGFLGLNLHYLPPTWRRTILRVLMDAQTRYSGTPRARLSLTWKICQRLLLDRFLQPMVHRYLFSHVRSEFVKVHEEFWENAAMLPVQQFQKESSRSVWGKIK